MWSCVCSIAPVSAWLRRASRVVVTRTQCGRYASLAKGVDILSRDEATIVLALWSSWDLGEQDSNARYSDFYFEVVRQDSRVRHINAFEVLDLLTNLDRKRSA